MRTSRRWGVALVLAVALAACGDDDEGFNPSEESVAGSYTATSFTLNSGAGAIDLLALGATITATLNADGTTSGQLFVPGGVVGGGDLDEDLTGTWALSGSTVTFSPDESSLIEEVDFAVAPNRLTGEGTFQGSVLLLVLTKDE